jgi:hypothetical protein
LGVTASMGASSLIGYPSVAAMIAQRDAARR